MAGKQSKADQEKAVAIRQGQATIGEFLNSRQAQLAQVAAASIDIERLIPIFMAQVAQNPLLAQCTVDSVYRAFHEAVSRGLEPTGTAGGAHLVPYWNSDRGAYEAQLMIDYRGLLDLARRSGQVAKIVARVVYTHDIFEVRQGTEENIVHVPVTMGERGAPSAVYAVVTYKDGTTQHDWDTWAWVQRIKGRSRAKEAGPWVTDEEEMGKKSILRRLTKLMPSAAEARAAVEFEEAEEARVARHVPVRAAPESSVARIQERLTGVPTAAEEPPEQQPASDGDPGPTEPQPAPKHETTKKKAKPAEPDADTATDASAPEQPATSGTADGTCGASPPEKLGMTELCEMVGDCREAGRKIHRSGEGTWPVEVPHDDAPAS